MVKRPNLTPEGLPIVSRELSDRLLEVYDSNDAKLLLQHHLKLLGHIGKTDPKIDAEFIDSTRRFSPKEAELLRVVHDSLLFQYIQLTNPQVGQVIKHLASEFVSNDFYKGLPTRTQGVFAIRQFTEIYELLMWQAVEDRLIKWYASSARDTGKGQVKFTPEGLPWVRTDSEVYRRDIEIRLGQIGSGEQHLRDTTNRELQDMVNHVGKTNPIIYQRCLDVTDIVQPSFKNVAAAQLMRMYNLLRMQAIADKATEMYR